MQPIVVEGLAEDAEEVTLSKTENLLNTVTEGATFSQERKKTSDGWEGVTILLPVAEVEELRLREEAYVFAPPCFCLKRSSCLAGIEN